MKIRILVCEDDRNLNQKIQSLLVSHGYEVISCQTIDQLCEKATDHIDLFLLDVHMNGESVFDCLNWIHGFSEAPILLLSADLEESSILEGYRLNADEYIEKPVRPQILLAKINAAVKRAGLLQETIEKEGWIYNVEERKLTGDQQKTIQFSVPGAVLFKKLFQSYPAVVSKEVLKSLISADCTDGSLRVRFAELRKQLPDQVEITNLRGKGYQLVLNQRDLGDE